MTSASKVYRWCMEATRDAEYCADVKNVVAQIASTRAFSYDHPSGKPRFLLLLPSIIYVDMASEGGHGSLLFAAKAAYATRVLIDDLKRGIIVTLEAPSHAVSLMYERHNNKLTLKKTAVSNVEIAALMNGPLNLPA